MHAMRGTSVRVSFCRLRSARPQRRLPPGGLQPSAVAHQSPPRNGEPAAAQNPTPGHAQSGPAQAADGEDTTARRRAGDPPPP